ncbi:Os07g0669300 [Oryza sativa Japonica Group]|uniref:Os07g0669300 protein n=2 Tax=Oryza TaxID=4527 RepID=A0A0P0X9Y7_ORYSJ|nr:Os07g0669300 [Oryza sativa Japonica Group]
MATTLQSCLFSCSPATALSIRRSPLTSPAISPAASQRNCCLPRLKTTTQSCRITTAARPPLTAVQCQKGDGGGAPPAPPRRPSDYLQEEKEKVLKHYREIISIDDGCLTVRMYVNIVMAAADDSYDRKVSKKTVESYLRALRGLAAVTHVLLDDALEAVSHRAPMDSLAEYAFNSDVKPLYDDFQAEMNTLVHKIDKALDPHICRIAVWVMARATQITGTIIGLMVSRRKRALENARSKMVADSATI